MVERPRVEVARAVVLDEHNNALVVRRAPDCKNSPDAWEFPGGKREIDTGETLVDTLCREGSEEIGCEIVLLTDPTETSRYLIKDGFRAGTLYVCYSALARVRCGQPRISREHTDLMRVPLQQLSDIGLTRPSRDALSVLTPLL